MDKIKLAFRRIMLSIVAMFPSGAVTSKTQTTQDDDNLIKHKDDRLDILTRRTRMWASCFPKLNRQQREDPKVHAIMPWNGRGHLSDMAELTRDQWDPSTIQQNKGK